MDPILKTHIENLHSTDRDSRYESYMFVNKATNEPVDWAYEVWDDLVKMMSDGDNHQRSIAAQLLANLAKSDVEARMRLDIDKIMKVTYDEKFVTARHALQSVWKIAVVNKDLLVLVTDRLASRFQTCLSEKNCTLIRFDIIEIFRKIYDRIQDAGLKDVALELIASEEDLKYRKKYAGLWKDLIGNK